MKKRLVVSLLTGLSLTACSISSFSQGDLSNTPVTANSAPPIVFTSAKAYVKNDRLSVAGEIDTTAGEHSNVRGELIACVYSKDGQSVKEVRGFFGSREINSGPSQHHHLGRTFSIELGVKEDQVSKIEIYPSQPGSTCRP